MKRIAIANLKGGVGKSTTTLFLAEGLALHHKLRALVLDLDPQANCSFMLLSRKGVESAETNQRTLPHYLLELLESSQPNNGTKSIELQRFLSRDSSDLGELKEGGAGRLDLLPSIPRMWFVENKFEKIYHIQKKEPSIELGQIFDSGLKQIASGYDVALIDCPPGFSSLTRMGLLLSDAIISPTIADEVSARSLRDFVDIGLGEILGFGNRTNHHVVISKFIENQRTQTMRQYLRDHYSVLEPSIRYSVKIMDALSSMGQESSRSFRQKYQDRSAEVTKLAAAAFNQVYERTEIPDDR
ncbi:MAG: ParA family protein [Methyloligellaceae bacterium]